jgi:hypothetical protein
VFCWSGYCLEISYCDVYCSILNCIAINIGVLQYFQQEFIYLFYFKISNRRNASVWNLGPICTLLRNSYCDILQYLKLYCNKYWCIAIFSARVHLLLILLISNRRNASVWNLGSICRNLIPFWEFSSSFSFQLVEESCPELNSLQRIVGICVRAILLKQLKKMKHGYLCSPFPFLFINLFIIF